MAHCKVQEGSQNGIDYRLQATPSVLLDTRSFDIGQSLYPGVRPNVVQLVLADDVQYLAPIDPSGTTEISPRTLQPLSNAGPFDGFKAGARPLVALGELRSAPGENAVKVVWLGRIEVVG